jgi:hypothetical protein
LFLAIWKWAGRKENEVEGSGATFHLFFLLSAYILKLVKQFREVNWCLEVVLKKEIQSQG